VSVQLTNTLGELDAAPRFRRVLLLEDEATLRRVIARNLTSRGLEVVKRQRSPRRSRR
jgi:ActR/RegA family two-component response regulator